MMNDGWLAGWMDVRVVTGAWFLRDLIRQTLMEVAEGEDVRQQRRLCGCDEFTIHTIVIPDGTETCNANEGV